MLLLAVYTEQVLANKSPAARARFLEECKTKLKLDDVDPRVNMLTVLGVPQAANFDWGGDVPHKVEEGIAKLCDNLDWDDFDVVYDEVIGSTD